MAEYNGWKNYETWLAALHIDNDESTHDTCRELAASASSDYDAGEAIVEFLRDGAMDATERAGDFVADIIGAYFDAIDKRELGAHFREDAGLTGPRRKKATRTKRPKARKKATPKRATTKRRTVRRRK
jgi:hypothetical protein